MPITGVTSGSQDRLSEPTGKVPNLGRLVRAGDGRPVEVSPLLAPPSAPGRLRRARLRRRELGIDVRRAGAGNSFASGHATAAAAVAVALGLVLAPTVRGAAAVLGAVFTTIAGVATLSAGWHR